MKKLIINLTLSAMFLAMAMYLPFLTGQIPQIGSALLPMHIPVLFCGIICGPFWGAGIGLISPLLRFMLFGMPPLIPTGLAMTFELCAYGLVVGLLYSKLPKKPISIFISLISAMIAGRLVWGLASMIIYGIQGTSVFTISIFISGALLTAIPGIILQLVLIPSIILILQRAKVLPYQAVGSNI